VTKDRRVQSRELAAWAGFLYAPNRDLLCSIVKRKRLVTVWGAFRTPWYAALERTDRMLDAIWVTRGSADRTANLATVCLRAATGRCLSGRARFAAGACYRADLGAARVATGVIMGM